MPKPTGISSPFIDTMPVDVAIPIRTCSAEVASLTDFNTSKILFLAPLVELWVPPLTKSTDMFIGFP